MTKIYCAPWGDSGYGSSFSPRGVGVRGGGGEVGVEEQGEARPPGQGLRRAWHTCSVWHTVEAGYLKGTRGWNKNCSNWLKGPCWSTEGLVHFPQITSAQGLGPTWTTIPTETPASNPTAPSFLPSHHQLGPGLGLWSSSFPSESAELMPHHWRVALLQRLALLVLLLLTCLCQIVFHPSCGSSNFKPSEKEMSPLL